MSIKCQLVAIDNIIKPCYDKILNFVYFSTMKMPYFLLLGLLLVQQANADYSLLDAQKQLMSNSPAIQASHALYQADVLQAESLQKLHYPRISLNAHAFALQQNSSIPLDNIKEQTAQHINTHFDHRFGNAPDGLLDALHDSTQTALDRLPDHQDVKLRHDGITPNITATMPIYTGGLISSSKNIANLQAQRGKFGLQERISLAKLNLIRHYFNVQLQKQLTDTQQNTLSAMQLHVDNAYKLEQQGFISRGQRMQFEVARNQVQRLYQNTQNQHQNSIYELAVLLGLPHIEPLSTPLFINTQHRPNWQALLKDSQNTPLNQKLKTDILLADENIALRQSTKKPKIAAVARYTLDDKPDWFAGVAVQYNLLSGIDRNKQIGAAHLQKQAAKLGHEQVNEHITTTMHTAYGEMVLAQKTHALLQQNHRAAKENLRIQTLSFQEGFGTVAGVVDAQSALSQIDSETALNAYRYLLALATLLHHTGTIDDFDDYLSLDDAHKL